MSNLSDLGRLLLVAGSALVLLGLGRLLLACVLWLGHLPGDIRIRRGHTSFYFPVVTCLLLSTILTVFVNLSLLLLRRRCAAVHAPHTLHACHLGYSQ
jgi:hypothetical protein